jgi:PAS domain S-box-containing protein
MNTLEDIIRENILESMPSGLIVIGEKKRVHVVNPALCEILGYPREYFLNQDSVTLSFDKPENDAFKDVILDVVQNEHVHHRRQVWYVRPDGENRYLEVISSFLRQDTKNWGLVVLVQDLTDLQRMHEREKTALEDKSLLERQRAESLNNLAQSIAHQIRNPVMSIGGFTNLALKHLDNAEKTTAYLRQVLESAERLQEMTQAVREYVSLAPPRPRQVTLASFVLPAAERIRVKARQTGTTVHLSLDGNMDLPVQVDPDQLGKAMDAFLENALEACDGKMPSKGLRIDAAEDDGQVVLEISDRGHGIAGDILPYVCDPFFTTKAVGSGMGLTIASRIVSENKGSLDISSLEDAGTTVTLRLPARRHGQKESGR